MDEATKAKVAELEAENALLKAEAAAKAKADMHNANVSFCENLVKEGKLTPAVSGVIVAALDVLADQPVNFGEGDGAKPLTDALKEAVKSLPKIVEFGEVGGDKGNPETVDFAAPRDAQVDPQALALHAKAVAYQREHNVDYLAAVKAVGGR